MREIQHKVVEFEPIGTAKPTTLAAGSFGLSGSGKTAFLCTLPGKTGVVSLDDKTRAIIAKRSRELGITNGKIIFPREDFLRYAEPLKVAQMGVEASMAFYTDLKMRVFDAVYTLVERRDVTSIAFDEGDRLSKLCLLSNYGRLRRIMPRDRGPYNEDIDMFFNTMRTKNCVITHKAKEIWTGPENNRKPSGRFEWAGHSDLDYAMDVVVEHFRGDDVRRGGARKDDQDWYLSVHACNHRPDLIGDAGDKLLSGAAVSFGMLALQMWPDSDPGVWE